MTNVFTSSTNVQNEVQYDTFPRRKKKKEKKEQQPPQQQKKAEAGDTESPLTVIDGNYSFNISSGSEEKTGQKQEKPSGESGKQQRRPPQSQERRESGEKASESKTEPAETNSGNSSSVRPSNPAQSLFQQIQAREADTSSSATSGVNKNRKLSLKEKRKLRAEQREMTEFLPKSVEIEEPAGQAQGVVKRPDHSSESDVSMRSDLSPGPKRDSEDVDQLLAANGLTVLDQQGLSTRPRSNGINLMAGNQALSAKPNSREFAVSRALGKYRQKKKERESSNSDSQEELDLGIENTLKSLDAKLAEIEESSELEPRASVSLADAAKSIPSEKVQSQLSKFEEAGLKPIEAKSVRGGGGVRSRRISEDSIDPEDEWYKHEMTRLTRLEVEQKSGMSSVLGELGRQLEGRQQAENSSGQQAEPPPARAEKPPDPREKMSDSAENILEKKVVRRSSRKQLVRKSTTSVSTTGDNSADSSITGSADEADSETQSGEDEVEEEQEEKEVVVEPTRRPENLLIITPQTSHQAKLNISGLPNKPDLLEELTAAAAEDLSHYPDHLKNGEYGEDGIWYDDQGETGYWGEDGEWYDYMDEIGYYSDGGEWHEYGYSTGYWDDEGEWREKEAGKEAEHFLWVSEEGTNEFANDQVPSSELQDIMVIGRPASSSSEDRKTTSNGSDIEHEEVSITSQPELEPEPEPESRDHQNNLQSHQSLHEDEGGGGRWGAVVRHKKFEELRVRTAIQC